jgi:putative RecB family exonuclease
MDETPRDDAEQVIPPQKVYYKSVSNLKLYRECGLQWKFRKFDKIESQPAAWLPQGTAVHAAWEAWEKSGRTLTTEKILEVYYAVFDAEMDKLKEKQPDLKQWLVVGRTKIENDIANRRERGAEQAIRFIERIKDEPWKPWELPDGSPAVEVPFDVDFGFGPIRGYVDLIKEFNDGTLLITDIKTGNREKTALQLAVYAHAVNEIFGLAITQGSWYYAKDDVWSDRIDLSELTVEYLRQQFESQEKGIQNRVFLANPGSHCALCPAQRKCIEYTTMQS